jgi:hypothetical protein
MKSRRSAQKAVNPIPGRDELVKDTDGLEASEFPDHGRGGIETDQNKQKGRLMPQQTGETQTGDAGLRADDQLEDADRHGHA